MAISFGGYKALLYVDGAELLGNDLDRRFEKVDFDSLDEPPHTARSGGAAA